MMAVFLGCASGFPTPALGLQLHGWFVERARGKRMQTDTYVCAEPNQMTFWPNLAPKHLHVWAYFCHTQLQLVVFLGYSLGSFLAISETVRLNCFPGEALREVQLQCATSVSRHADSEPYSPQYCFSNPWPLQIHAFLLSASTPGHERW